MIVLIFMGTLLCAMALGMPIAFALLVACVGLMLHMDVFDAQIIAQNFIAGADNFPLLAIPFFMLAGEVMNVGGLSRRIIDVALAFVGHVKGGLGYVTIVAACILSALSGSAVADAAALSTLLVPMMVKAGHDKKRAASLVAASGVIGPVIPPSIGFVIFGVAGNVSITKLFLAGIMPGVYLGAALWITWSLCVRKENLEVPPRRPAGELWRATRKASWALFLPVIIIVGLRMGVFTPTEAAVVAAVYALFVSTVIYRELRFNQLYAVFMTASKTTAVVMLLVAAASIAGWLVTVANLPGAITDMMAPFMDNPTLLLLAIMAVVIVVGMTMDMTPAILILTPVLMPIVRQAGIDPVYFGVLFVINMSISLITPPVGTVLSVVAGVTRQRVDDIMRGVFPFLIAEFIVLFLLVFFPSLVTVPARWFSG